MVYGEMESSNYTGIGISCGGGLCNVCLSYLSVPVFSFSIPKAGDYIDSSAGNERGESATRIRTIKEESFCFNGHFASKIHQVHWRILRRYDSRAGCGHPGYFRRRAEHAEAHAVRSRWCWPAAAFWYPASVTVSRRCCGRRSCRWRSRKFAWPRIRSIPRREARWWRR